MRKVIFPFLVSCRVKGNETHPRSNPAQNEQPDCIILDTLFQNNPHWRMLLLMVASYGIEIAQLSTERLIFGGLIG